MVRAHQSSTCKRERNRGDAIAVSTATRLNCLFSRGALASTLKKKANFSRNDLGALFHMRMVFARHPMHTAIW